MSVYGNRNFYVRQDMTEGEFHAVPGGLAAIYTACAPGKETSNEDAAAIIPTDDDSVILAVAVGLGGARAGEESSSLAIKALRSSLEKVDGEAMALRTVILDGIEKANQAVQTLGGGAGTTLAVVEVLKNTVRPYHIGDSMILVVGQRGKVKLQTVSHSPVGFAVEAGLLDETEAIHHEDRHLVSNVLGACRRNASRSKSRHLARSSRSEPEPIPGVSARIRDDETAREDRFRAELISWTGS